MAKIIIRGGKRLHGEVTIGGAKNSTVALIPAAILADTPVKFDTVPQILDVKNLQLILDAMNVHSNFENGNLDIDPTQITESELPSGAIKSLRASYYFMGALLGRFNRATVTFPGGDNLGRRPIDQHIKGFEALGATVTETNDIIHIDATENGLIGARIALDTVSVGATINIILAAVRAKGQTILENAAREPEIIDIATFLNNMGANIRGAGTDTIRIAGVPSLKARNTHTVIPDRIEAGTYMVTESQSKMLFQSTWSHIPQNSLRWGLIWILAKMPYMFTLQTNCNQLVSRPCLILGLQLIYNSPLHHYY